jgi:predicted amidohydrolase YtcJ
MTSGRARGRSLATRLARIALVGMLVACSRAPSAAPSSAPGSAALPSAGQPSDAASPATSPAVVSPVDVVYVGRIETMTEAGQVEALYLEDGLVRAIGDRDEVLAVAGDSIGVIELDEAVAYPGFIDAHAHWIGDREYMGIDTPDSAMAAAVSRGWTSISEQWVDQGRLAELESLDAAGALRLRVDAYLALNLPAPSGEHLGDWYTEVERGPRSDRLTVDGVKLTFDNGWGSQVWWEPDDLAATVGRADEAGWQVSIHTVSSAAHDTVIDAFESAFGGEPNVLHHRIEHAIQVADDQLDRMVAADIATVIHLDGGAADWVLEPDYLGNLGEDRRLLGRWRDFADAGLHVAAASDSPWIFPDLELTEDIGRPFDQVAGGMDGRGRANPEPPAWVLDQLLTAEQGLRAITIDAAYALGDEANRGSLAVGTYADVTILSGDLLAATPDEIRAFDVLATIVGGIAEHCAGRELCPGG